MLGAAVIVMLASPAWAAKAAQAPDSAAPAVPASGAKIVVPPGAAGTEITAAEALIFTAPHMHGVAPHTELDYSLVHKDMPDVPDDTVRLLVLSEGNSKSDAALADRSGPVQLSNEGLACNPVVLYFLQRDIAEMEKLTGGQRRYFQKRIRMALASGPAIRQVTRKVDGKPVGAREIAIQPYLNDPNASRFEQFLGKRYTFVLSDTVPGEIMEIRTDVPGANSNFAEPLKSEVLSFKSAVRGIKGDKPLSGPQASL
jgi:hypothetical protein